MINAVSKRLISLLLLLTVIISAVPIQAYGLSETEETDQHQHMEVNPIEETVLLKEVKSKMDAILVKYLGTKTMSKEDVEDTVWGMEDDTLMAAWDEVGDFEELASSMTDAEFFFLLPDIDKHSFFRDVEKLGVLPRKTFSMGEADEKRFYMEAKKI